MKKYAIHLPENFGKISRAAYRALGANPIYAIGSKIFLTDESDTVDLPTATFDSFDELERWLNQSAIDWLSDRASGSDGADDAMADELENWL